MEHFSNATLTELLRAEGYECDCGKHHRTTLKHVIIESGALKRLPEMLSACGIAKPFVVADHNTWSAAGEQACAALDAAGVAYSKYIFPQAHVEPDEFAVGQVLMSIDPSCDAMLPIGSGTINDICKMVARGSGRRQVVVATAPSMDGYVSNSSSMIHEGVKTTIYSVCPDGVLADIDIVRNAPMRMLQSGLGDMLAKYISVCEWRMSHIITGEYYCEEVANLMRSALKRIVAAAPKLPERSPEAVKQVLEGLLLSGVAMSFAEVSRPASGLEHYFSHIWEMHALMGRCRNDMHGIQVGVGTVLTFKLFDWLKAETPNREKALAYVSKFDYDEWCKLMRDSFGQTADVIINIEKSAGKHDKAKHAQRLERIIANWDELLRIAAAELPAYESIVALMQQVGEPTMPQELELSDDETILALHISQEIRDKYILSRLLWDLGLLDEYEARLRGYLKERNA